MENPPDANAAAALRALKTRMLDKTYPTLSLARDLETYRQNQKLSHRALADRLEMRQQRPYLTQVIGLLGLPQEVLTDLEGKVISSWDIKKYLRNQPRPKTSTGGNTTSTNGTKTSTTSTKGQNNENTSGTTFHQGNPPEETAKKLFKHGGRTAGGGGSDVKTLGELIVSVMIGLAFVPAYVFCWMVHQRAFDDLCEIEERAHRRVLETGPWTVIHRVLIGFMLIILVLAYPRIKKGIHWLRHPEETSTQTTQATPPAPATPTLTPASVPSAPPSPSGGRGQRQPQGEPRVRVVPPAATAPPAVATPQSSPLLNSNDVTQLGQAFVPQTGGFTQRVGNAIAMLAGKAVTAPAPNRPNAAAPVSTYPGPANLAWQRIPGSRNINLSWQDLGAGFHYNLYASYANDQLSFDRDGYLLRGASTPWIPPAKGTQVFLFYVTAVNPQGQESAPSERILVDLR